MAETLDEARDLVARAQAAGRIHAVVQNRRYLGQLRRVARAIAAGSIGAVTSVHADFFLAPHFGGFREEMDHVLLLDMAIHGFDAMRCMTGLPPPASIAGNGIRSIPGIAMARPPRRSSISRTAPSSPIAELGAPMGSAPSWECEWRIVGAKGALTWDGREDISIEVARQRTQRPV